MFHVADGLTLFRDDLDIIAESLEGLREDLQGAKLLITGGTGFFGIWLLEGLLYTDRLLGLNLDVCVLSRNPSKFLTGVGRHLADRPNLHWLKGGLLDFDDGERCFSHIIHAASLSNVEGRGDWARAHFNDAVLGTSRLIGYAERCKVRKFLAVTSGAVYGGGEPIVERRFVEGPHDAGDYTSEKHVYAQAKRSIETMSALAGHAGIFHATIARCFAFVGPYLPLNANYAIGNFIRDALARRPITVSGDGTALRSYLYAADLVIWLMQIMVRGGNGRPYNVGGGEVYSIRALADLTRTCVGGNTPVHVAQTPLPGVEPHAYLPSIDRAREDLGLVPRIVLRDAIDRTLAWHRMHA